MDGGERGGEGERPGETGQARHAGGTEGRDGNGHDATVPAATLAGEAAGRCGAEEFAAAGRPGGLSL